MTEPDDDMTRLSPVSDEPVSQAFIDEAFDETVARFVVPFMRMTEVSDFNDLVACEPCEEGGFTSFIPGIPGAISQGETVEEAKRNALEALHELLSHHLAKNG